LALTIGSLVVMSIVEAATPIEIHDTSDSRALMPLQAALGNENPVDPATAAPSVPSPAQWRRLADRANQQLVTTPALSPGQVVPRRLDRPVTRPVFLVGADRRSRAWLAQRRAELQQLAAVGLLVEAHTPNDVDALVRLADGLPLLPVSAQDLAGHWGLRHYPVLMTRHGIVQ
jgi:integrating conjugative element protein (TIGR03765 family)